MDTFDSHRLTTFVALKMATNTNNYVAMST